jgi:hypothetical protein
MTLSPVSDCHFLGFGVVFSIMALTVVIEGSIIDPSEIHSRSRGRKRYDTVRDIRSAHIIEQPTSSRIIQEALDLEDFAMKCMLKSELAGVVRFF